MAYYRKIAPIKTVETYQATPIREYEAAAPRANDSQPKTHTARKPDMSLLENRRADAPIFDPTRLFGRDWGDWVRTAAEGGALLLTIQPRPSCR